MHSHLITGSTSDHRFQQTLSLRQQLSPQALSLDLDPDTFTLQPEKQSLGIDQIRYLKQLLPQKPASGSLRFALIPQAETLTLPAQNALLKILEEPPSHAVLILAAPSEYLLLPTIRSRCQLIKLESKTALSPKQLQDQQKLLNDISTSSISQRLALAQRLAPDRPSAIDFCQAQLHFLHRQLIADLSPSTTFTIKQINRTLEILNSNANFLLALENLLLKYPSRLD